MITVVNLRTDHYTMYVDRPNGRLRGSPFKNPFHLINGARRRDVLLAFVQYFYHPDQEWLRELALTNIPADAILGCWCHPLECHADIVAGYVNWKRSLCEICRRIKPDVCERENVYKKDIDNSPGVMYTVCDDCHQERCWDI